MKNFRYSVYNHTLKTSVKNNIPHRMENSEQVVEFFRNSANKFDDFTIWFKRQPKSIPHSFPVDLFRKSLSGADFIDKLGEILLLWERHFYEVIPGWPPNQK